VLPLTMDDEAPSNVPDMQVTVPERDDAATPSTPTVDEGKFDIEPDVDASTPEPVALTPGATATALNAPGETPAAPPKPAPAPAPAPIDVAETSAPPPAPPAPPAKPKPAPEKPAAKPTKPATDDDPVLALLGGGKSSPKPADTGGDKGRVYVQVGAFGDAGRAAAMVDDLKKQGFAAYAEPAGKVTRVRIGPLARAEGEKTVASLRAKGREAKLMSR